MTFLDTNILVYAIDKLDSVKQSRALSIIAEAISTSDFMISAQVLNEFSNVSLLTAFSSSIRSCWLRQRRTAATRS